MMSALRAYFAGLAAAFGSGWNRFWFTPENPLAASVLRIGVGLMSLLMVGAFTFDLIPWFADGGRLPLSAVAELHPDQAAFSYLDFAHTPTELWTAHVVGLGVLFLFTLGAWTRVMNVLALGVVLAYCHRGPELTGMVEPILAPLLFYLCFTPSGAYLSFDAWRARRSAAAQGSPTPAVGLSYGAGIALRLAQVHVALAYLMMALSKLTEPMEAFEQPGIWLTGQAAWYLAARTEYQVVDLTGLLGGHPFLINAWSHAILLFELAFPLLVWNRLTRPLMLMLAVPMWLSLGLVSGYVTFSLVMLVANLVFVPPAFWRTLLARPSAPN